MLFIGIEVRKDGSEAASIMGARTDIDMLEEVKEIETNEEVLVVRVPKTDKNAKAYDVLEALIRLDYEEGSVCGLLDQMLTLVLKPFSLASFSEQLKAMVDKEINSGGKNIEKVLEALLHEWKFLDAHQRSQGGEDPVNIFMDQIFHPNERLIQHLGG